MSSIEGYETFKEMPNLKLLSSFNIYPCCQQIDMVNFHDTAVYHNLVHKCNNCYNIGRLSKTIISCLTNMRFKINSLHAFMTARQSRHQDMPE